jgi:hypothetical protein
MVMIGVCFSVNARERVTTLAAELPSPAKLPNQKHPDIYIHQSTHTHLSSELG